MREAKHMCQTMCFAGSSSDENRLSSQSAFTSWQLFPATTRILTTGEARPILLRWHYYLLDCATGRQTMLVIKCFMNNSHLPEGWQGTKSFIALKYFMIMASSLRSLCGPGLLALAKHPRVSVGRVSRLSYSEGGSHRENMESTMLTHVRQMCPSSIAATEFSIRSQL